MTEHDSREARATDGRPFSVHCAQRETSTACGWSTPTPRPTTASTTSSPTRCCGSSSTTCGTCRNAPDIRRNEVEAFEFGYNVVNEDLARAVLEEIEGEEDPVVMVHDYHLYTLPALVRRARPDAFLHHFVHIPWTQPDSWRVLPTRIREDIYDGLLANDIVGFHTRSYRDATSCSAAAS